MPILKGNKFTTHPTNIKIQSKITAADWEMRKKINCTPQDLVFSFAEFILFVFKSKFISKLLMIFAIVKNKKAIRYETITNLQDAITIQNFVLS